MRVEFSTAALADTAAFRHLVAIVWMFVDGRHRWVVPDLDAITRSPWLAAEGESFRRNTIAHAKQAARRPETAELRVSALGATSSLAQPCWALPADTAEFVLRQPVTIVVENAKCDGAFLRLVLLRVGESQLRRRLGDDGFARLRRAWQNPLGDDQWLSVRHGGGDTTATQVELLVEVAPTATRRIFVLVDSDRAAPTDPPGPTAQRVASICAQLRAAHPGLRLEFFILSKREVENYLPREALARRDPRAVGAWDQLDSVAKDHEDLKKLFSSGLWKVMLDPDAERFFHVAALRERSGQELDSVVKQLIALL